MDDKFPTTLCALFLARATERVHDKKDKRFSNFAGSLEDRDRLGAESADEQHIQWVAGSLKAMGEERYAEFLFIN